MAGFTLDRIKIDFFRGIKNLEFEFNENEPTVLIGPNNSGKTTFLDAIGLCLGSPKFYNYSVMDEDFWKCPDDGVSDSFAITVMLKPKVGQRMPAVKGGVGDPVDVYGVKTVVKRENKMIYRYALNQSGEVIVLSKSTPVSTAKKENYKGMGFGGRVYARYSEVQSQFPEVWQLDPKNLYLSLYEWKTGPLQKLLKIYKDDLMSAQWTTSDGHQMPGSLDDCYRFLNNVALKTPFWRDTLVPKFNEKLKNYLGNQSEANVEATLSPIDTWLMSQLVINICPSAENSPVDCKRLGDGWQSLLRLISLEIVSEVNGQEDILLLMEEPESYLHPHLRKKLKKIISIYQEKGSQVIFSTHSQEMVGFSNNQKILRLRMTSNGVVKNEYSTTDTDQNVKDDEILYEKGNHEIVFANKVVLTEGKGDKFAVKIGLDKNGFDCDSESVTVVDCGSVDNIPRYATICNSLGIPWFAVHDNDMTSGVRNLNTQRERDRIEALLTENDRVSVWDNSLEDVLGYANGEKAKPKSINSRIGSKTWDEIKADTNFSKYAETVEEVLSWLI